MIKHKITLHIAAMCAALLVPGAIGLHAAVCNVPSGSYPTIQSAASDATCTTINVAPGAYNENVAVNNSTTINGAQAGNPVSGRTSGGVAESTVMGANPSGSNPVVTVNAPDVTIDGFTFKNAITTGAAVGVDVKVNGNDAVIMNNFFDGITTTDPGGSGTAQAVDLETGPDNVNVSNNEMKNVQSARSAKGVLIGFNGGTDPSQNVLIKGNSIHDITSTTRGAYAVLLSNVAPGAGGTPNLSVQNNTVFNLTGGGWVHAIGLEGDAPAVVITDNDFSTLSGPSTDTKAVWFESEDVSFASGAVHTNNFNVSPPVFGIAVDPALSGGSVNGTCNWWNSPTGPTSASNPSGTGANVSANVTFAPWLLAPAPSGNCFGGNVPATANQCKNGGWMTSVRSDGSTFKNQGDCIQYVNTGK